MKIDWALSTLSFSTQFSAPVPRCAENRACEWVKSENPSPHPRYPLISFLTPSSKWESYFRNCPKFVSRFSMNAFRPSTDSSVP